MALLTVAKARQAGRLQSIRVNKSATASLNESTRTSRTAFDIFLSHSRIDAEIILGIKQIIEDTGKTVYVDWIDDPHLDRSNVTAATAEKLRSRMKQCKSLFYAHSGNASKSRWMPWELGFFDGYNGNVAILPIVEQETTSAYRGEEYLGIYPYVDFTGTTIYVHKNLSEFRSFDRWRENSDKLRPAA
jgi:hypothetical protein